jgi:hypothetical protein
MKVVVSFAVALTLVVCSFAVATDYSSKAANKSNTQTPEIVKVSHDGFAAMRAVRAARIAIFNGEPKMAMEMLDKAKTDLETAAKEAPMFIATEEVSVEGKPVADEMAIGRVNWIPIDGQVSLADTFVATPEKAAHIQKANEHFKNGQSKQAIEELRLASIDATCTRVLMSLPVTTNCVAEALKLMGEQKYYEANIVLKAAEDGLVVTSASLFATPKGKTEKSKEMN